MSTGIVRVLIADDSVVYRSQIRAALSTMKDVEVVAVASNGKLAIERINQQQVNLLILDLEMPEFNGLQTLLELKRLKSACKILVFSSSSKRGSEIALEALRAGASDFVTKPDASDPLTHSHDPAQKIRQLLEPKILALFSTQERIYPSWESFCGASAQAQIYPKTPWDLVQPKLLVIGSSTGGPNALEKIFSEMQGPYTCPIIIVQHMPPVFTATFAERISKIAHVPATEAQDGAILQDGCIYVAPGNFHLRLVNTMGRVIMKLDQGPMVNSVRPAVDPLFESAAEIYKEKLLAMVLTGMGNDGRTGAIQVKKNFGTVIIQDQATSVVFGMPGAVLNSGAYDQILALEDIAAVIGNKVRHQTIQMKAEGF